jgi:hypothetical protein
MLKWTMRVGGGEDSVPVLAFKYFEPSIVLI